MLPNRPFRLLRQAFHSDDSGAAIVEFAIVAPVLLVLALGVTDIAATTLAKFKSSSAAVSAADLATQSINLQTSDMVDIFAGAADVMAPFSTARLQLRISSIASNGNGAAFVYWSCGQDILTPNIAGSTIASLPNGSLVDSILYLYNTGSGSSLHNGTNTSFIQVESQYVYTAPTGFVVQTPQTMASVFFSYPRQSAYVGFPWDGSVNQPTAPASTTQTASVTLANGAVCNYAY